LGYKQLTFEGITEGEENFFFVDPKKACLYASSDSLCTYLLVTATAQYFKESGFAGKLDQNFIYPLMWFEQEKVMLDGSILTPYESEVKTRLEELEREIYKQVGYVININSPAQVSTAFQRLGLDTGVYTKTGMSVGIKLLDQLSDSIKENFPVIATYTEYKKLYKSLSSYIKVLENEFKEKGFLRCNYKTQQVPTARLASGKDRKNSFFAPYNIQSTPKFHPAYYYVMDMHDRSLFNRKENTLYGYKFIPVKFKLDTNGKKTKEIISGRELYGRDCIGEIEGADPKLNLRRAFLPHPDGENPDDWVMCSIDYSARFLGRQVSNYLC
jgi:hypothetical protein